MRYLKRIMTFVMAVFLLLGIASVTPVYAANGDELYLAYQKNENGKEVVKLSKQQRLKYQVNSLNMNVHDTTDLCFINAKNWDSFHNCSWSWMTSNEDVASVDAAGVISAKAPGTATITLSYTTVPKFLGKTVTDSVSIPVTVWDAIDESKVYSFKNVSSGWFMNLKGAGTANGTEINLYPRDRSGKYTQGYVFRFVDGNKKFFTLSSCLATNKFFDVRRREQAFSEGQGVCVWEADNDPLKTLSLEYTEDGSFYLIYASYPDYCVAPKSEAASRTTQTQLVVCKKTGEAWQRWYLCDEKGLRLGNSVEDMTLLDDLVEGKEVTFTSARNGQVRTAKLGDTWSAFGYGSQCFSFATTLWYSLYGTNITTAYYEKNPYILDLYDKENIETVLQMKDPSLDYIRSLNTVLQKGDFIQISYFSTKQQKQTQHSMIVTKVSSTGIEVVDANWFSDKNGNPLVNTHTFSWSDLHSKIKTAGKAVKGISVYRNK